jgi:tRNA A-37 threonylcarbamoyl transferase component Bud32/tetratricopeptide (TPR) repeat protein
MPDLKTSLSDRYVIARELGAGGMATVYLARDVKHERDVALKVLRPELAAAMGAERFLREIRVTANLHHPHILALYDSGEAAGFLYYVMPYVEGESLRARLEREKQLPLDEALRITREVADALGYAHSHGIVHRDIKPENILLESGHAVVADFGIARAISAAGGETLTATGIAVGTPAYMSPEQAAGERDLDGRSDLYALGCVLYEMLAGRPPFGGPTAESVVHQHLTAHPPSVTQFRATVSAELAQVVDRALAKTPADRYPTMGQLIDALGAPATGPARPRRRAPARWAPWLVGAALLIVAAVLVARRRPGAQRSLDPNVVAVLPFRVSGPHADIGYLREGMVDLLAAKLTGRGGPRAVDPRTVVNAWRRAGGTERDDVGQEEAERVARRAGAGRLLLGSVVGSTDQLTLSAALYTVGEAGPDVQAAAAGPADSLLPLVDRLTARLLAREAGESERLLEQLTSTSLPALRAYLEGQAMYRRGGYEAAAIRFNRALDLDSTFALAGLGLVNARIWSLAGYDQRGLSVAWAHRDRLSPGDSVLVEAMAAPPPQPTGVVFHRFEQAAELEPDRPEFWYWEGEEYFHLGPALEIEGAHAQARQMFERAVALDSTFSAPLEHLLELAAQARDTAGVRRLLALHLAIDSAGDLADFARWRAALALGDSVALRAIRARLPAMATTTLWAIAGAGVLDAVGLEDVDTAAAELARRAVAPPTRVGNLLRIRAVELDRGRPSRVVALGPALRAALPPSAYEALTILAALFDAGDTTAAAAAARSTTLPGAAHDSPGLACAVALWREAHGQPVDLARVQRELRAPPPGGEPPVMTDTRPWCDATLGALAAATADPVRAGRALARLDSVATLPFGIPYATLAAASFVSARLHEQRGDLAGARAALRRQVYHYGANLASRLRQEGRLAALMGDRDAAIRAYQHYLALRADAEPAVQPEVDEVREALGRLVRE